MDDDGDHHLRSLVLLYRSLPDRTYFDVSNLPSLFNVSNESTEAHGCVALMVETDGCVPE